jgi:hypothetical protein
MLGGRAYSPASGEMPMVLISDGTSYCHGVLVADAAVVSPASCVEGFSVAVEKGASVDVYVDVSRISKERVDSSEVSAVSSINIHPSYNSSTFDHNIAVLMLGKSVVQAPATMPSSSPDIDGATLDAYSFFEGKPASFAGAMVNQVFLGKAAGEKDPAGSFPIVISESEAPGQYSTVFDPKGVFVGFTFSQTVVASVDLVLNVFSYSEFIQETIADPGASKSTVSAKGASGAAAIEEAIP